MGLKITFQQKSIGQLKKKKEEEKHVHFTFWDFINRSKFLKSGLKNRILVQYIM